QTKTAINDSVTAVSFHFLLFLFAMYQEERLTDFGCNKYFEFPKASVDAYAHLYQEDGKTPIPVEMVVKAYQNAYYDENSTDWNSNLLANSQVTSIFKDLRSKRIRLNHFEQFL